MFKKLVSGFVVILFVKNENLLYSPFYSTKENGQGTWIDKWNDDPDNFLKTFSGRYLTKTTLYEQLWRGFLPEAQFIPLDTIPDFHAAYQRTYIERGARLFADVSDWQLFVRFLR